MSTLYRYDIKAKNPDTNLADRLVECGFAVRRWENIVGRESLHIDLTKLSPELLQERKDQGYSDYDQLIIWQNEVNLEYVSLWSFDDRILEAISKAVPDELLIVERDFEWYESLQWYEKDGKVCNAAGVPLVQKEEHGPLIIHNLSPKLIKECDDGDFVVRLPIGNESDKWGTLRVAKDDVLLRHRNNSGTQELSSANIFFTKPEAAVTFRNHSYQMPADEIVNKYYASKNGYREHMKENLVVERSAATSVIHIDNQGFYIVKFHCPYGSMEENSREVMSTNREFSITVPKCYMQEDSIIIGERGKPRSVMVVNENGNLVKKQCTNGAVYDAIHPLDRQISTPSQEQEDIIEEQEIELE